MASLRDKLLVCLVFPLISNIQVAEAADSQTARVSATSIKASPLWAGANSPLNPMVFSHPRYCTVAGKVAIWATQSCKPARVAWKAGESHVESSRHSKAKEVAVGSVSGVITWQFNDYVGSRGDSEATAILFPEPARVKVNDSDVENLGLALGLGVPMQGLTDKYGLIVAKCDGNGDMSINDVPAGDYWVLILSKKTTRNFHEPLTDNEEKLLSLFFADDRGRDQFVGTPEQPQELLLHKWAVESVKVTAAETSHFGHDFGNTYI